MPIARELRHLYRGAAWEAIRQRILTRERQRCKFCTRPNGQTIATRYGAGRMYWHGEDSLTWLNETGWRLTPDEYELALTLKLCYVRVQLGVAHLNHNPRDNRDENLAALCRWCHLQFDKGQHRLSRQIHKDEKRPLLADQVRPIAMDPLVREAFFPAAIFGKERAS